MINDQLSIEDVRDHLRALGRRLFPDDFTILRSHGMRFEAVFSVSGNFNETSDLAEHGPHSPCA